MLRGGFAADRWTRPVVPRRVSNPHHRASVVFTRGRGTKIGLLLAACSTIVALLHRRCDFFHSVGAQACARSLHAVPGFRAPPPVAPRPRRAQAVS